MYPRRTCIELCLQLANFQIKPFILHTDLCCVKLTRTHTLNEALSLLNEGVDGVLSENFLYVHVKGFLVQLTQWGHRLLSHRGQ